MFYHLPHFDGLLGKSPSQYSKEKLPIQAGTICELRFEEPEEPPGLEEVDPVKVISLDDFHHFYFLQYIIIFWKNIILSGVC